MTKYKFNGIAISIPTDGRRVDPRWALSLTSIGFPVGMNISWGLTKNSNRALNREQLVEKALEAGAKFVFFIDDDTVCPSFGLQYLFYALNQEPNAMIAGGIYCTKEPVPSPIVFRELGGGPAWDWKISKPPDPSAYMKVAGIGTGCMLIRTDIFAKLERPWFAEPNETFVDKTIMIGDVEAHIAKEAGTDDLYFCRKAVMAGKRFACDCRVKVSHMDWNTGIAY